jgi:predicted PurR-regulated permease PerM
MIAPGAELPPSGPPRRPTVAVRPRWGRQMTAARQQIVVFFFFAAFSFLLYQLYLVIEPFLAPIGWAALLALVFYPLYLAVLRRWKGRSTAAALALTTLVTAAVVVPTVSLSSVVTSESVGLYQQLSAYVSSGNLNERVKNLRDSPVGRLVQRLNRQGWEIDVGELLRGVAERVSNFTVAQMTAIARNVAVFLLNFTIMVFTLFFFFRDGEHMYRGLRELIPMDPEHKDAIFYRLYETLSAVMRGMLVTAVVQGILTWIGLLAVGVPYAAFLGVFAAFMSMIPVAGPVLVWLPCAVYLALTGGMVRALILLTYGTIAVSMADNVLRPRLIGDRAHLPTIFLFFGMLGGVEVYGFLGIFLGPVLIAAVVAFLNIYKEEYATEESAAAAPPIA